MPVSFVSIRTKLREMAQKRYIEHQRDTDKLTGCLTKAAFEYKLREFLERPEHNGVLPVTGILKRVKRRRMFWQRYFEENRMAGLHCCKKKMIRSADCSSCGRWTKTAEGNNAEDLFLKILL